MGGEGGDSSKVGVFGEGGRGGGEGEVEMDREIFRTPPCDASNVIG